MAASGAASSTPHCRRMPGRADPADADTTRSRPGRCGFSWKRRIPRRAAAARASTRKPSTGSPQQPASRANGGMSPAVATLSAPIRSARCSRRWDCRWHRPPRRGCTSPRWPRRASCASCRRWSSRARASRRSSPSRWRHRAGTVAASSDCSTTTEPKPSSRSPATIVPRRSRPPSDGRRVERRMLTLPPLPAGYHTLHFDGERDGRCRVVVAPPRCFLPPDISGGERRFGLAAHLYALHRRGDQGIGDFTTLSAIAEATARAGGSIVGINPLHALFAEDRERASPYHPSDRRFLDPVYIDVEAVPDLAAAPEARALLAQTRPALRRALGARQRRLRVGLAIEAGGAGGVFRGVRAAPGRRSARCRVRALHRLRRGTAAALRAVRGDRRRASARALARVAGGLARARCRRHRANSPDVTRAGCASRHTCNGWRTASSPPPPATGARAGSRSASCAISPSARRRTAPRYGRILPPSPTARRWARRRIRSRRPARTGACRHRIRGHCTGRPAPGSASSSPPTCATPAHCGSIT